MEYLSSSDINFDNKDLSAEDKEKLKAELKKFILETDFISKMQNLFDSYNLKDADFVRIFLTMGQDRKITFENTSNILEYEKEKRIYQAIRGVAETLLEELEKDGQKSAHYILSKMAAAILDFERDKSILEIKD